MNIERFIEARKATGFSQVELAEGICTQATLSRFENNGQVPNLKILIKLCNRLGLPLADLFPRVGIRYTETIETMNKAEFFLVTSEYEQAAALLNTIAVNTIADSILSLRYFYLKGFIMIFQNCAITDILFNFDKILLAEDTDDSEIFRLLAYTGTGMVYFREADQEKAEFYFNKVLEQIYSYETTELADTWRVLNIVFQCSVFYAEVHELEASNTLLKYAISICSDNHVTFYLARAAFQLVKNAVSQNESKEHILELVYDARAYAKINKNYVLLRELAVLEKTVLSRSGENKL
ncbi:helix-turn-helix domain-containing protein [Carnobacterium antarcticum]|uniref:Helix-turn-helix domain-containing protein n=1 Tax=Carnobacterium antarcticum TaxID=2126436 RepID=A0ABW4NKV9_9LACT|nr:helix-turn-helix transcriptional regulator [Carnobacterium sp. CP1]ALV22212.1 Transcriptional regulator, Cro/CI [Carnobacterium sp. CP1]